MKVRSKKVDVERELAMFYKGPGTLKPEQGNARTHPKTQINQIKASIEAFGFTNPVLVDEDNRVIAGHGRLVAAKELGLAAIPVITLTGLSEIQKRALRLADNKIALGSAWDDELLRIELNAIRIEMDPEVTGFTTPEIDIRLSDPEGGDPDDEIIPEAPQQPVTRKGDIWICGPHRIGCGDCRDEAFLRAVVGAGAVDAAFLDPPYNVPIEGHAGGKGKIKHREFQMASGEMSPAQFEAFLRDTLGACVSVTRDGGVHFVCMDHRHMDEVLAAGGKLYGARLNLCVWNKSNAGMGSLYRSKHELVFVYRVGSASHRNNVELGRHGRNRTNVWSYPSVNSFKGSRRHDLALHPTVKNVGLVADALLDVTKRGERVLDAFLGSGTTLIACERVGRICRGVEIDPAYVDLALDRWRTITGVEPVLESTGKSFAKVAALRAASSRKGG